VHDSKTPKETDRGNAKDAVIEVVLNNELGHHQARHKCGGAIIVWQIAERMLGTKSCPLV
jgi:hypothetical protein